MNNEVVSETELKSVKVKYKQPKFCRHISR